jgi:Tol biopolymer transport system component
MPPASASPRKLPWAVAVVFGVAALVAIAGFILFRSERPEPRRTFTSRPLTYDTGSERDPSFSPDGNWVAYSADGGNPEQLQIYIALAKAGTGAPTRVTNSPWKNIEPSWSPDGKQIVFARILESRTAHEGSPFKLILAPPVENAPEQELTDRTFVSRNDAGIEPSWSPDGKYIFFGCRMNESSSPMQICVYSLERDEVWALTFPSWGVGDYGPQLSPDARTLVYAAARRQKVGLFLQALTPEMRPHGEPRAVEGAEGVYRAAWSRDGKTLYFMGSTLQGESGLWSVGLSTNDEPQLLWPAGGLNPSFWQGPLGELKIAHEERVRDAEIVLVDLQDPSDSRTVLAPSNAADFHPQFSPDGSQIAFMSDRSGTNGIWICDRDGSNLYSLIDMSGPALFTVPMWSPDGKRIAVDAVHVPRNAHIVDVATKRVGPALTSLGGRMPAWTKDGKALYYYSDIGGKRALWKLGLETNEAAKLIERPGILDIAEDPDGRYLYFLQGYDLMRVPLDGSNMAGEPKAIASEAVAFSPVSGGVYFRTRPGAILKHDEASGRTSPVMQTDGRLAADNLGFTVSRDERWLVYTRWGRWEMDLKLLESVDQK